MNLMGLSGFRDDWPTWILALVIAIGLYYFVSQTEPIEVHSRAVDLIVVQSPAVAVASALPTEVNMRVEGPKEAIKAYLDSEPKAELILTNATEGPGQELRFAIRPEPTLGQVKVTLTPQVFLVDLERRTTRQYRPQLRTVGELREGLVMADELEGLPQQVMVTGPDKRMQELAEVVFRVDLSKFEGVTQQKVNFQPIDAVGVKVPFLQITPADADVRFFVSRKEESVRIPVLPQLTGGPAPGWLLKEMRVEPNTVEVSGPGKELARLQRLLTEPIVIDGISTDQTYTAKVAIPKSGGYNVTPTTVTVRLLLERLSGRRTFGGIPIALIDQAQGMRYSIAPAEFQITVQGDLDVLEAMLDGSLRAQLRVAAFPVGEHQVRSDALVLALPPGVAILNRSPEMLQLSVVAQANPDALPGSP